jgi:hypothetical protein
MANSIKATQVVSRRTAPHACDVYTLTDVAVLFPAGEIHLIDAVTWSGELASSSSVCACVRLDSCMNLCTRTYASYSFFVILSKISTRRHGTCCSLFSTLVNVAFACSHRQYDASFHMHTNFTCCRNYEQHALARVYEICICASEFTCMCGWGSNTSLQRAIEKGSHGLTN